MFRGIAVTFQILTFNDRRRKRRSVETVKFKARRNNVFLLSGIFVTFQMNRKGKKYRRWRGKA